MPLGEIVVAGDLRTIEAYPSLALEVRNQRDMESFDQLLAGGLDLAVRSREALPHGLRFEPLFASDRLLIVPRGHELAGKKRPTLRDLARHAFVIPPAGSRWRRKAGCPWAGDAEGTGASSATAAVTRLLEEAGRKVV